MALPSHRKCIIFILSFLVLISLLGMSCSTKNEVPVGVILNMDSFGQTVSSCISMAISDFYFLNKEYKTRLVLHTRDSKGEPLRALSVGLDLLENVKVQAILGPETPLEAKLLSILGEKAKVPILSLTTSPSTFSAAYPYFLRITQDETNQWKGVAAIVESFKWKDVVLFHEDNDFERQVIPYIIDSFRVKSIHVSHMSAISPSAGGDQILEELRKLSNLQANVFIVHVSPSLAFRLLVRAKRLGLMSDGYAWIVTDKTMNFFDPVESDKEVLESFQGVLGFRYHIPASRQFREFSRRWRKEYIFNNPSFELRALNIFDVLAYDAIWAIAMAVERAETGFSQAREKVDGMMAMDLTNIQESESGKFVLKELLNIAFKGLSGECHLVNGKPVAKPLEIVNVIGKGERTVGFWTENDGITTTYPKSKPRQSYSLNGLEAVIWPGGSMTPPRRIVQTSNGKKLRIAVPLRIGFNEFVNVEHNPRTNTTNVTGLCVDVFNAALEALPYKVPYEFVPVRVGNQLANSKTYNDLVHQVYLQNFDAVVGDTTITANRSLYVDFTITYTDLGVGTITRDDHQRHMWWFMKPFDTSMWVTAACSFLIIAAVIWFIEYPVNRDFQGSWPRVAANILWFSFSTLTFSQRTRLLSNLSRFLVIVWLFIVLIMVSCYNAVLSSMLTVQQIQLTRREIDIGYQAGSFMQGVIVNNSNFKDPALRPYNTPEEYASALSNGSKNGGVIAIMDELPYVKLFLAKYGHAYALVSYELNTNGFGFVFPKGSSLVHDISTEIAKLREEGTLLELEKKWFKKDSSFMPEDPQAVNPTILTLYNFRGLFLIAGTCVVLVLFLFLIHHLYKRSYALYYTLIYPRLGLDILRSIFS